MRDAIKLAAIVAVWCVGMAPGLFLAYDAWAWLLGLPQFYDWETMTDNRAMGTLFAVSGWCAAAFFPCLFVSEAIEHSR